MHRSPILLGLFLALSSRLSAATPGQSHLHQDSQTSRKVRVYIPGNLAAVRGILFIGNGAGGDASFDADKAHFQSWADKHGFAIAATGFFSYFQDGVDGDDWRVLQAGLQSAATASAHPELLHAPFVNWGFSNGGQMAYGLARLQQEKTLAFIVNKGGFYQTTHGTEPLGIPALFIAGEIDNTNNRRATIEALYKNGRAQDAAWAWLEERRAGHVLGNSEALAFAFFEEVLALRYPDDPANVPSAEAPPALAPVSLTDGWLVDQEHAAWSTGFCGIRPALNYGDNPLQKGWVPSETAARLYRASASYDATVPISFGGGYQKTAQVSLPYPAVDGGILLQGLAVYHPASGVTVELVFPVTHQNWSSVRFYDGSTLLGTATNPGALATLSIALSPVPGRRLNALHAEIDFPGGLTRGTHPVWLTPDATRAPLSPENLSFDPDTLRVSWQPPANVAATAYSHANNALPDTTSEGSETSTDLSQLPAGSYTFQVRARSSYGVWGAPALLNLDIPLRENLSPPGNLASLNIRSTRADLSWTLQSLLESGFEVQRRIVPASLQVLLDAPAAENKSWTWTPGLEGLYEIAARTTRAPGGETRAPYTLPDASSVRVNQSNHGPADIEWEFQDAAPAATLTQVAQTGIRSISNWTSGISGSSVVDGSFRIRSPADATSFAGGTSLGYSSGIVVLEADFNGWNVVGGSTGQWFQLSLNNGQDANVTGGITLEQNAAGLLFYGRALGNGSSTPSHQFPNTQSGPVTLRLQLDFTLKTLTASYRAPDTAGLFVTVGSGALDSARSGVSLRLRMSGDWSGTGEFLDLSRIRILPAPPVAADPAEWVSLGTQHLTSGANIRLGSEGTRAPVVADALRFTPVTSWQTVATLPSGSTGWTDNTLSPEIAYEYRIRALGAESVGDWSAHLSLQTPADPYLAWAASISWNGADDAPSADADLDRVSNLLEFAFGGDPLDPADTPRPFLQAVTGGLELRFTRASADLDYIVETTDDLAGPWTEKLRNPGSPGEEVTVSIPAESHTHLFLRVRVE